MADAVDTAADESQVHFNHILANQLAEQKKTGHGVLCRL